MKIVTWNIAGGFTMKGSIESGYNYDEENLNYFINRLKSVGADCISLQESHTPTNESKTKSQGEIIAKKLKYSFYNRPYDKSHIKDENLLSLVNLSKFNITKSKYVLLPNPKLEVVRPNGDKWHTHDKGFLISEIDYKGEKINFVNGHIFPFHHFNRNFMEDEFLNIREFISDLLKSLSNKPTIVAVDMNFNDLSVLLPELFKNNLYKESFLNIETAPGHGQQDHIMYSKHWNKEDFKVTKTKSDHYICSTDISLKQNKF
ncbi:hypothetical protein C0584_03040 [Candidatus Parcubacteria bacterium]|nr:MAG: hypothetical protein C0584_03040 [Candidatus Parcubacteria bacterium]